MPCPSEKQFLYHLIISQLYHDGYKPHATLLEEAALDTHQAVIPSDNLRSLLSICSTTVRTADSNFTTWNKAKKCSESIATRPVQQSLLQLSQLYNHAILPAAVPSSTQPVIHINPITFEALDTPYSGSSATMLSNNLSSSTASMLNNINSNNTLLNNSNSLLNNNSNSNSSNSMLNNNTAMLSTSYSSPSPLPPPPYKQTKCSPLSEFADELNDVLQVSSEVLNITNSPRNPSIPLSPIEVTEPTSTQSNHSSPSANTNMSVAQSLMLQDPPSSSTSPPSYSMVVQHEAQQNTTPVIKEEPMEADKQQSTQELLDKLQSLTNAALNNSMFQKLSSSHLSYISSQISSQRINPPSPGSSSQQQNQMADEPPLETEDIKPCLATPNSEADYSNQNIMTFGGVTGNITHADLYASPGINKEQLTLELEEMFTSQLLAQNTDKLNNILTTLDSEAMSDTGSHTSPTNDEKLRKPTISYPAMIAMAILNSESKRLLLGDIYKYIMDKYPYYRLEGQGWRNSIRHNLSLNDCFMKAGRAESGKGHYWTVRPDSIAEFKNGGYRRRLRRTCTRGASHAPQETMRPQISISPFLSQLSQLKAEEVQSSSEREPEQST